MKPTIFLSYARGDDEPFLRRLYDDLVKAGFDVWFDQVSMPSRQLTFYQEIRDAIAARDRLVLVVGPKAVVSAYVEQEWRSALEMGKCVNPIIRLPLIPPEGYADVGSAKDAERKARDLVPEELKLIHAEDFRDDSRYAEHLANLIRQLADPSPPLGKLVAVPNLPTHYRSQPDRLRHLRDALLIDLQKPVVVTGAAARVGVEGMAGIGKSVLAAALARDLEIRRAFPDGIFWIGIGQLPQQGDAQRQRLAELQRHVARELGHEALFNDPQVGKEVLRDLLGDGKKAVLLVIDDVWQRAAADAFDVVGPRCRLLLTTRDAGLVTALAGTDYQVQLPSEAEALALLASTSGSTLEDLPEQARRVVAECGRLPLALALCGGMVRGGTPWSDLLDALREHELEFLADDYATEEQHQNIARALELSIRVLTEDKQKRFAELAVFPEDAAVPEAAVLTLWSQTGGLSERHARQLLLEFKQRSIAQYQPANGSVVISLHDLMHHLATRMAVRLFGSLAVVDRRLLDAYRKKFPEGWHTGPDDGYFIQNLCRHLAAAAGNCDEAAALLCDLRFVEARIRVGQVFELIADYQLVQANLPEAQADLHEERAQEERVWRWTAEITEYAQQWSNRRDRLERGETVAEPEPKLPKPVPTCEIWSDERIQAECERIIQMPTRRDRLEGFAVFVKGQCYPFLGHGQRPGFVVQQAFNTEPRGSVHDAAVPLLAAMSQPCLLRRWPSGSWHNPKPALLRTLEGRSGSVSSVCVTADGRRAVSGSFGRTLQVWDLESGRCLNTLEDHRGVVASVSMTIDGLRAVSGGWDMMLRVWDVERGQSLLKLGGHSDIILSVSVTADGRRAVSGGADKTLRVWDLESGHCLRTLVCHCGLPESVCITADGRRAVSGNSDATLQVWDLERGQCLRTLKGHSDAVKSLSVTPDGRQAVSGSDDKTLRVWDLERGQCLRTLKGHSDAVKSLSVTPDGRQAVSSGGTDRTLRVWDLESGHCLRTLVCHCGWPETVSVTADGRRAVSGNQDTTLQLWDLESGQCPPGRRSLVSSVCLTVDGRRAVSGDRDHTVRVWDLKSGRCLRALTGHKSRVESVSVTADGRRAVSWCSDKTVREWNLENGQCLRVLKGHSRSVGMADGRRTVSWCSDDKIRVWDLASGQCLRTLEGHSDVVLSVSVTTDGRRAVSGSLDKTLRVWDLASGQCLRTLEGHSDVVLSVSVTADGRRAVSGSDDNTLRVWDLARGQCLRILEGHKRGVSSVSVTADGRWTASASYDKTLRAWDLESGQCMGVYPGTTAFHSVAVTGLGNVICAGTTGEMLFLELHCAPSGSAILTAANPQQARCPACGQLFALSPAVATAIRGTDVAGLMSHCPHCQLPLQFNLFFSAAEDYAEVLRDGLEFSRREKGDEHEETLAHLVALATHFEQLGQPEAARPYSEEHARLTVRKKAK